MNKSERAYTGDIEGAMEEGCMPSRGHEGKIQGDKETSREKKENLKGRNRTLRQEKYTAENRTEHRNERGLRACCRWERLHFTGN